MIEVLKLLIGLTIVFMYNYIKFILIHKYELYKLIINEAFF